MKCKLITHQDAGRSKLAEKYPACQKPIVIESDVFIGVDSTVLMGCTLGESSLIGAKSLVRIDVKKKLIVAGVPVKII